MAYGIDPYCPACNRLAATLTEHAQDRVSGPVLWISGGNRQETREFAAKYDIPDTSIRWILRGRGGERFHPAQVLQQVGIYAVPMRLILSSDNVVRDMRIANEVLDREMLTKLCEE